MPAGHLTWRSCLDQRHGSSCWIRVSELHLQLFHQGGEQGLVAVVLRERRSESSRRRFVQIARIQARVAFRCCLGEGIIELGQPRELEDPSGSWQKQASRPRASSWG